MKKLTNEELNKIKNIVFRYDLHYKMWDWLYKHPDKYKTHFLKLYPEYKKLSGPFNCFACAYADKVAEKLKYPYISCIFCPLKSKTDKSEDCCQGLYNKWCDAQYNKNYKASAKYAKKIRDLPLDKMYNFEDVNGI